jgi:shikimate kinase
VIRPIVLVGLPGSGKSTVGPRAALLLATGFSDIDLLVSRAAGIPVAEIFARDGEAAFRSLERAAMERVLSEPPHVIAPGAGWVAEPGNLEAAGDAVLLYLEISPAAAAARLAGDATRPLLAGSDPVARLTGMLETRERWYRRAALTIPASGSPESVAALVAEAGRRLAT